MTTEEFRQNTDLRGAWRAILAQPATQQALLALELSIGHEDVSDIMDPTASVRRLSRQFGQITMLGKIKELAEPLEPDNDEDLPTYGAQVTQEQLRKIEAEL